MKKVLGALMALAGVAGGLYVVYKKVLTPEARQSVDSFVDQGLAVGKEMGERVQSMIGSSPEPTGPTPEELAQKNRELIAQQWKELGF